MTELELVDLCGLLYSTDEGWDQLWPESQWGLCAALKVAGAHDVVIHRGSITPMDWYDDACSEAGVGDPDLGLVPGGFYWPLRSWDRAARMAIRPGAIIIGHSLGAARAVIHAALLMARGDPPLAVIALGCPRAGTAKLQQVLGATPIRWYRNASDPVPEVPLTVPWLLPWVHPGIEIKLKEPGIGASPLKDHHFELYRAGVAKISPMPVWG